MAISFQNFWTPSAAERSTGGSEEIRCSVGIPFLPQPSMRSSNRSVATRGILQLGDEAAFCCPSNSREALAWKFLMLADDKPRGFQQVYHGAIAETIPPKILQDVLMSTALEQVVYKTEGINNYKDVHPKPLLPWEKGLPSMDFSKYLFSCAGI
jgi:hypothetical protein